MPKITIIAPVYGVEQYIDKFLGSIKEQTFQDYELILVDDGSKDNCPQILDAYAEGDSRVKVIHQENSGVSAARNAAFKYITGEYVYIIDSDDWLEPTALENLWKEAEKSKADIIYGEWVTEASSGPVLQECFAKEFVTTDSKTIAALQFAVNCNSGKVNIKRPEFDAIRSWGGAPWRAMIRSAVILDNDVKFDPYVRGLGDDILFTLHLYQYVKKIAYIKKTIYHYRKLDNSYSHGFKENYFETIDRIIEKQQEFLKKYKKGKLAQESFYTRVMLYLMQGMERYFLNTNNPKSEKERYQEFKALIKKSPYAESIKNAPVQYIGLKRLKFFILLLRFGMTKLCWSKMNKAK
ncbi:MAG: glycosyltransferase [Ruminococcus sp.]|nr:glycosyltransferase [Ruminococcus sp.]